MVFYIFIYSRISTKLGSSRMVFVVKHRSDLSHLIGKNIQIINIAYWFLVIDSNITNDYDYRLKM